MIGDPQNLRPGLALDKIDRAAKDKATVDGDRSFEAAWIVSWLSGQAEGELEKQRFPLCIRRKLIDPHAQIGPHARDFVLPDAIDCRREALVVFICYTLERLVERFEHPLSLTGGDGKLRLLQGAEELGLDLMKQAALGERIHALQRLGLFERRQTIRRRQKKSIRTRGELLQRGHRIGPRVQPLLLKERPRGVGNADEAIEL